MAEQPQINQGVGQGSDLTMKQFAESVRNKYPDSKLYKTKSDFELSKAFIASDPKYKTYEKRIKDWPLESSKSSIGYRGGQQWPITPKNLGTGQEESFSDTLKRGIQASKTDKLGQEVANDPVKRQEYFSRAIKEAPWGKAAATYGSMMALPFAMTEIGTGIFGKKVVRDILTGRMKSVPSVASKIFEHLKQPGTIIKTSYGRAIEYYLLSKAGVSKTTINKILGIVTSN